MEVFIGSIMLFPYGFVPLGWKSCEGQILDIFQNQVLFSLIGCTFGGDGRTTFALPNLKGAEPVPGMQYCIAIEGLYPSRN